MYRNVVSLALLLLMLHVVYGRYEPNWESLDKRPLPGWYDQAKFGIFIHWGVFSVPSYGSEWFWRNWKIGTPGYVDFMKQNYRPGWTYADFANQFTAEFYKPDDWADIFKASGAKYVVLTSKHHEGFTNWPSNVSWNWNAMAVGPKRDLVGDLANSVRARTDLHFGLYHSLFEWFNPLYLTDQANQFKTQTFVRDKTLPELYEIVNQYKPEVIWSDGSNGPDTYWNSTHFLAWLYNDSPVKDTVVVNDRWGTGVTCHHGDFYTCHDNFNPGYLFPHKWENCMTIDKGSWGYRRNTDLASYRDAATIIASLVETVSCGGNLLLNVGPTHDGRILPIFEERLRQVGSWLEVNGECIYGTKPWTHQNDTVTRNVWYTAHSDVVYAIALFWPANNTLSLGAPSTTPDTRVTLVGYNSEPFKWSSGASGITITIPAINLNEMPCSWAWVFKLEHIKAARPAGDPTWLRVDNQL